MNKIAGYLGNLSTSGVLQAVYRTVQAFDKVKCLPFKTEAKVDKFALHVECLTPRRRVGTTPRILDLGIKRWRVVDITILPPCPKGGNNFTPEERAVFFCFVWKERGTHYI